MPLHVLHFLSVLFLCPCLPCPSLFFFSLVFSPLSRFITSPLCSSLSHQCIRSYQQKEERDEKTSNSAPAILTKKSTTSSGHCLYCTRKLKYQSDTFVAK